MHTTRRKALYLFLSSLLGILLLQMLHRSIFVIYDIIGDFFPAQSWLNLDFYTLSVIDFSTVILFMFIGGWYGIWLGLHWYKQIYEDGEVMSWFHGFVPHNWRSKKVRSQSEITSSPAQSGAPKKLVVESKPSDGFQTFRSVMTKPVWNFDEIKSAPKKSVEVTESKTETVVEKPVAKKRVAKKRVAKKSVRKVAKKTADPEVE
mgnify:CR=1 FL=1